MNLDFSGLNFGVVCLGLLVAVGILLFLNSLVIVGGQEIAVLERRWFGQQMPDGRVVALSREIGIQARILGPGLYFLIPFLFRVVKKPLLIIEEDQIGLVDAVDGVPVQAGRIFARAIEGHNLFQDGEAFLKNHGQKGSQLQVLPPGIYRVNPYLFRVQKVPVVTIENNRVGVVVAADGNTIPSGRLLGQSIPRHENFQNGQVFLENGGQKGPQIDILLPGQYRIHPKLFQVTVWPATLIPTKKVGLVTAKDGESLPPTEYVARAIPVSPGHADFQNAGAFLAQGGQRGPQMDFLKPGIYYINPLMFEVNLDDVLLVQRGEVAAIVSNVGKDPAIELLTSSPQVALDSDLKGVERYVVKAGFRGIQKEVLGPGTYYLNGLAFTSHIIPTTNITIDWADEKLHENSPRVFDPLEIVSHDGFEMTVEVKVILRVQPEQAPHMVARIGTIQNLVEHVIHPLIDSSFRNQASSTEAMKFMQDRHVEQSRAEKHVVDELRKYHVDCVSVLICQIKLPERLMQTMTDKVVATQQMSMFDAQQEAEGRRREMEKIKAQANLQPNLVKAEIDVQIASQQKQQAIILAEGKSQSTRLEQEGIAAGIEAVGKAEGEKIRAIGQATAEAYQLQAKAIGQNSLSGIEIMKTVAEGKVKITPEFLVQGGGSEGNGASANVLSAFMASLMLDKKHEGE